MDGPAIAWLPDGRRLHMRHGPIDLIVEAFGAEVEKRTAYAQAAARFRTILGELVAELPDLRKAVGLDTPTPYPSPQGGGEPGTVPPFLPVCREALSARRSPSPRVEDDLGTVPPAIASGRAAGGTRTSPSPLWGGVRGGGTDDQLARQLTSPTARRMAAACLPHAQTFVTPMAAVAGAVADEVLAALLHGRALDRAYVNNGGDIALHLAPGRVMRLAIAGTGNGFADRIMIDAASPVRGVATSGWRGRSHSLGIADAVTVLARSGAAADVAATLIANAVDLPGHEAIARRPARELAPDSDLGDRLVTVGVGALSPRDIEAALGRGLAFADAMRRAGLIEAAALFLAGNSRVAGAFLPLAEGGAGRSPAEGAHPTAQPLRAPLWPVGHLPHTGGDQPAHRLSPIAGVSGGAAGSELPISPRVGEMAGSPEGGNIERSPRQRRDPRSRASTRRKHA